eukprot:scaffold191138_cov18-Tisochrysis_lutea.AAC.1
MQIPDPGHITPSVNRLDAVFGSIGSGAAGQWQLQQDVPAFKGGRDVDAAADDSDEEAPPQQLMPQALIDDSGDEEAGGLEDGEEDEAGEGRHAAPRLPPCHSTAFRRQFEVCLKHWELLVLNSVVYAPCVMAVVRTVAVAWVLCSATDRCGGAHVGKSE